MRSVHWLLKERFLKPEGLADSTVTVLDPAAGTLTFLVEATRVAVEEFISRYGEGGRERKMGSVIYTISYTLFGIKYAELKAVCNGQTDVI